MKKLLIALFLVSGPAYAADVTIFGNSTPTVRVDSDTQAVTLGVKFLATGAGNVSGVRFYRGASNRQGYTVKLFSERGTLLVAKTVSSDTCTVPCWEEVRFSSPVPISANTTYVAAYYTNNGRYAGDNNGLTNGAGKNPLIAQAGTNVGGNGVYTYSTGFPNKNYRNTNYWVDVLFAPTEAIAVATLSISFNPANPTVPATAKPGDVVATIVPQWSDGAPFTGTLKFDAPYNNSSGLFAINGSNLVIAPGAAVTAGTKNVTITATQ